MHANANALGIGWERAAAIAMLALAKMVPKWT